MLVVVCSYAKCSEYIYQYDNGQLQVAPGCSQEETLEVSDCTWDEETDDDVDDGSSNEGIDNDFKSFDDEHDDGI